MGTGQLAERIESVDIASAGVGELTSALGDINRIDGWVSIKKAAITRRLGELEAAGEAPPASDVLARSNRSSARQAAKDERRAEAYGNAPALGKERAAGRISDEHADALANAAGKLDDEQRAALFARGDELAEHAAASTPVQFAHHLKKLANALSTDNEAIDRSEQQREQATLSHGTNDTTGMGWVRADLHPDDYQKFKNKLNAEVTALRKRPDFDGQRYDQVAAAAFVGLVTSTRAAAQPVAEVVVLIDLASLQNGTHAESVCEYTDGTPEIHHLLEWDRDHGPTDLAKLLPVCTYHHHRAHEGRWQLQLDPSTRELTVFLPDGTLHSRCLPDLLTERPAAAA